MKRIIAVISTAILAIGLAVVGVSGSAVAGGSDSPVPYTVTTTSLTLPGTDTFSTAAHNDGNVEYIPLSQYVAGQTYTHPGAAWTVSNVNFHIEQNAGHGAGMVGKNVLPFDPGKSDGAFTGTLPTSGYCIVWVQVDAYNEHFGEGGQAPICTPTAAKLASAATTTIAATCAVGQTLDLSAVDHATFGAVTYTPATGAGAGDRTFTVTATADSGYTFLATGTNTLPLSGSLTGPLTTNCASTTTSCVSSATWAYTFTGTASGTTAGGVITASNASVPAGTLLCAPLYVRSATWNYDLPTNGNNPSWGQTLDAKQDVVVTAVGVPVAYSAPDVKGTCQQHDIYATFSSNGLADLAIPTSLHGPNDPYEPAFLHATLNGKGAAPSNYAGPNPTYSSDPSAGCTVITPVATLIAGACYWDAGQQASFKTATLSYDNTTSNVPVDFTVTGYPAYTRTVPGGETVTVSIPAAYSGGVSYDVVANGKATTVGIGAYAECPPTVQTCSATTGTVLSTNLAPNGWTFAETRANGHNVYVAGALHIWTDGFSDVDSTNVNIDKAAGYYIPSVSIPLSAIGVPSLSYTNTAGSLPGIQLTIDKNGNGGFDGNLVYESGMGTNPTGLTATGKWWATHDLSVGDSSVPNPSYQKSWGTLSDYLKQWPNAKITAIGYSLGSGAKGDGLVTGLTAGCQNFTFDQADAPSASPANVTFQDVCGIANDGVFIPTPGVNDHYTYTKTVDTRDPKTGAGNVTVVATAEANYAFPGGKKTMSWSHTFLTDAANNCVVIGGDPAAHNPVCAVSGTGIVSGYITVNGATGVTYRIHNVADGLVTTKDIIVPTGDTNVAEGSYTVTVAALPGYTLTSAITQFTALNVGANPTNCGGQLTTHALLDPQVSSSSPVCTNGTTTSGSINLVLDGTLNYFVGSTQLTAARNPMPTGSYSVRAVPVDPADSVNSNDPNPMNVVISALTTSCAQLKTLAFTGGAGPSAFLIATSILLLLGGALIFTRKPRRPRHTA